LDFAAATGASDTILKAKFKMFSYSKCSTSKSKLCRIKESTGLKQKAIAIALLVLMSSALLFTMSSPVFGQSIGLYIYEVTPQNSYTQIQNCTVHQPVSLIATIGTVNGTYQVYFDKQLVDTGTSQVHFVDSNFTVPELPGGTYNITLVDVGANLNTTYSFPILTQFLITPEVPSAPAQLQEGSSVVLNVTIAGGDVSKTYGAVVSVVLPSPLGTNYTKTISMTTSALGTAQAQVTYPDPSFSPADSSTLFNGTYNVYFNLTQNLAQAKFGVGFTDLTQYHRGDTVQIRALGYAPGQRALVDISYNNVELESQNVTVSDQGVVTSSWLVPSTAALGPYTARISLQASPKAVPDVQTFQVPGYPVTFSAVNLAGEPVPGVVVEAFDQEANQTYSNTTGYTGAATINLEKGSATVNAYYNQVKVGEINSTISGNSSFTISCQLSDLTIKVQDKNGVAIPFVDLNMTFHYVTRDGTAQNGTVIGQTDLTGIYTFNSTFTGISYTVQASKYSKAFNAGNDTISNLPVSPRSQINILCPDKTLSLNIVDYNLAAIPNARITLAEQASGIFYSVTSDISGAARVTVTFGQYNVNVYSESNILLNSTVVTVTSDTQAPIRCILFKLPVSVKVVDYFGNPISNVVVELSRTGVDSVTATTASDGTVTFNNIIGGSVEITAYPSGNQNNFVATNLQVTSPTTVTLTMDKYIVFAGSLVGTSVLATVILLVIVIVLLILAEIYKLTGFKLPRKTQS
jgi:hypothetical protein